jgi:hypothetical protein
LGISHIQTISWGDYFRMTSNVNETGPMFPMLMVNTQRTAVLLCTSPTVGTVVHVLKKTSGWEQIGYHTISLAPEYWEPFYGQITLKN